MQNVTLEYVMARRREIHDIAKWFARNGHEVKKGAPLPTLVSSEVVEHISNNLQWFKGLVKQYRRDYAKHEITKV